MDAGGPQRDDRRDPRRQDQVARRAVGDADAGAPEAADLVGVGHHAVGEPRPVRQPAGALEVVRRPAPERRHRELVVLGVLGEVGVQPDVEALGELGGAHHQRLGDAERRARCEGDPRHRAVAAVVVTGDGLLAGGEDVVVVGHDVVGRQAAVLDRQRHRATRRVEAHAEVAGGVDLGGEEVAGPVGVEVQVVGRRRAARQRQLGEPDPRRQVGALGVQPPPDRVQRLQPTEQRLVRHRRERPRQVLEQVVVGVHEARRDEAVGRIDDRRGVGSRSRADGLHEPVGDRHPAAGQLGARVVHRGDRAGVDDDDVSRGGRGAGARRRCGHRGPPGWRRWRPGRRRSSAGSRCTTAARSRPATPSV